MALLDRLLYREGVGQLVPFGGGLSALVAPLGHPSLSWLRSYINRIPNAIHCCYPPT